MNFRMLSIEPLTNTYLDRVLKIISVTKRTYIGSFPSCFQPRTEKIVYSFISNTDDHYSGGQHWCAWVVRNNTIFFFDSFGREPWDATLPRNFRKIVDSFDSVQYSTRRIQNWTSQACGYFCIHFIYVLSLGLEYKNFLDEYSKDFITNDGVAIDFVNSIIYFVVLFV